MKKIYCAFVLCLSCGVSSDITPPTGSKLMFISGPHRCFEATRSICGLDLANCEDDQTVLCAKDVSVVEGPKLGE